MTKNEHFFRRTKFCFIGSFIFLFLFCVGQVSAQWQTTTFPDDEYPYSITATKNGNILVSTFPGSGGYIFISTDKGQSFQKADVEGFVYTKPLIIDNTIIYAGRGCKIARTIDDGESWQVFDFGHVYNQPTADIYGMAYHNNKIFAAVFGVGICFSEDMGETWEKTDEQSLMNSYEVDGRNTYTMASFRGKLYAIGANGIWILNDDEKTWTLQREVNFAGNSLIHKEKLYISYTVQGGTVGLEYTEDGINWQEIPNNADLPSYNIRGFKSDGTNIFVGTTDKGVFYTPDEGVTWHGTDDWPPYLVIPDVVTFLSIPMDFCFIDDKIFAASYEKGIYQMDHPNLPTSNNVLTNNWKISVFPNPATNILYIKSADDFGFVNFEMYNITGKLIKSRLIKNESHIDVSDIPSGIYTILIKSATEKKFVGKIIIK